jgi:hypothetical protein
MKGSPMYILNPDRTAIKFLKVFFGLCALPSVILNLLVVAFGFLDSLETTWLMSQYFEVVFLTEIIMYFFTSFKDDESNETIISLKRIA